MANWLYYADIFVLVVCPMLILIIVYKGLKTMNALDVGSNVLNDRVRIEAALKQAIEDGFEQGFAEYKTYVEQLTEKQRVVFFEMLDAKYRAFKKEQLKQNKDNENNT